MARYYCDYCDSRCSNNSSSVRKQHNEGNLHRRNVYAFYAQFIGKDVQEKVDDIVAGFEVKVARGLVVPTYRTFPLQPVGFEEVGLGGEEGGTTEGAVGSESVVVNAVEKAGVEDDGAVGKYVVGAGGAVEKASGGGVKAPVGERSGGESDSDSDSDSESEESGSGSGSGSGGIGGGDDDVASDDFVVKEITPAPAVNADVADSAEGDDGRAGERPAKRARVSEGGDGKKEDDTGVGKDIEAETVLNGEAGETGKAADAADDLPVAGTEIAEGSDGDDSDMEMD